MTTQEPHNKNLLQQTRGKKQSLLHATECLNVGKINKGTLSETCNTCSMIDNENHRLNHCYKYRETNLYYKEQKIDFSLVHSTDIGKLKEIVSNISKVWNTTNAHGTMNKTE